MSYLRLTALILWASLLTAWGNIHTAAEQGDQAFEAGRISDAIAHYQTALKTGSTATLHYNLGNAYAANGQYGHAIVHYKRALWLNPRDADAQANLRTVYKKRMLEPPADTWLSTISNLFTANTWLWLGSFAFWLLVSTSFILPLLGTRRLWRRAILILSTVICALSALGFLGWQAQENHAIILRETPLKAAPTQASPFKHTKREGERVTLLEQHQSYLKIKDHKGRTGWVLTHDCERILPVAQTEDTPTAP